MEEEEPTTPRGQDIKKKEDLVCPGAPMVRRSRPVQLGENPPIRRLNFEKPPAGDLKFKQVPGD